MLSMRLLSRGNVPQYAVTVQRLHTSTALFESSSSSSSDSDKDDSKKKISKAKPVEGEDQKLQSREETNTKLNSLLERMLTKPKVSKPINLSVPPKKPKPAKKQQTIANKPYEHQLYGAAKEAAASLGGNVQKTESELLNKLLAIENKSDEQESDKPKAPINLKDFIAGMTVDRKPEQPKQFQPKAKSTENYEPGSSQRSARVQALAKQFKSLGKSTSTNRRTDGSRQFDGPIEAGNLYIGPRLNIFDVSKMSDKSVDAPEMNTWKLLEQKEFKLAVSHPPENIFQEMIMWTEQGKLWKFPIDNEQGMEEEHSIHFSEHVFMERNLKDWCPKRGPIRHFMQLVCVGLSKNPYMTVREKQDHLAWYREYFASKQDLLKEIGAIESEIPQAKQIST